jgi:hypothetical protein
MNDNVKSDEVARLEQENAKLRRALERVHVEILSRYIPFEIQEEIRAALRR